VLNSVNILAGVALMLLGIRSLRSGSDRLFSARLRRMLQLATKGRLRSTLAEFVISNLTPSSAAVAYPILEARLL
jgi:Na+/phosphate symporter